MAKLQINLLGQFAVFDATGAAVDVGGAKQRALLAFLALNLGHAVPRDRLIGLFWADRFDDQARQSLRQALTKVRRLGAADRPIVETSSDSIVLDPGLVDVDAIAFQRLAEDPAPQSQLAAADLYRGPLAQALFLKEPAFDEWIATERARFNALAGTVLERAANHLLEIGDPVGALEVAQRLIELDGLREPSHRLLMRLLAAQGQRSAALQHYSRLETLLVKELGVKPDEDSRRLAAEIRSGSASRTETHGEQAHAPTSAPPHHGARLGVAVLPFADLSEDGAGGTTALSIAEDITSALAQCRWLAVLGRFSVGAESSQLHEIARGQGARYAIEGSIRKLGTRLRVTVQLVDLDSAQIVWSQRFDRETVGALGDNDALAQEIAGSVEPELATAEARRARAKEPAELGALDYYFLGLEAQYQFSEDGNREAQRLLRLAADADPGFAAALARLAYAMVISVIYFDARPVGPLLDEALELARRAARLDDQDAVAHFALGRAMLARGEYEASVRELRAAIDLDPALAQAHCALGDSLAYSGRLEESIPSFEEALRISPRDPYRWAFLTYGAMAHLFRGDYEASVAWAQEAARVPNAHFSSLSVLAASLGHLHRPAEAKVAIDALLQRRPGLTRQLERERLFYLKDARQLELYLEGLRRAGLAA